jgi:WD40 repeat protein
MARIWDAATGACLWKLVHHGSVYAVTFSRDNKRIVTASADLTARVWNAATGAAVSPPLTHQGAVMSAAFSPDRASVVTASWDHTARVWDAVTGKPLTPPLQHRHHVYSAVFDATGTRVVTSSNDHTARIWNLRLASGTLDSWRAVVERASPHVLVNGVLLPRAPVGSPEPDNSTTEKAEWSR